MFHRDSRGISREVRQVVSAWFYMALCMSLLQFFNTVNAQAQKVKAPDDHDSVHVRYPEAGHLHKLQTDHDYQYANDAPPPENPVARFIDWLFRKLGNFLTSNAYQNIWQYVILAAIAGLVIYLSMKADVLNFLFPRKARSDNMDYENLAENIHEINFDATIDEAITERNFRLAVRLQYLQTLKRLTDAGHINYKPDKTNRQYVYELTNTTFQYDFERLTRHFEFVWYGDFPIDETRFTDIQHQFNLFGQMLKRQPINH